MIKLTIQIMWAAVIIAVFVGVAYMFRYAPTANPSVFWDRWESQACVVDLGSDSAVCVLETDRIAADAARARADAAWEEKWEAERKSQPIYKIELEVERIRDAGFTPEEIGDWFVKETKSIGLDCTKEALSKCKAKNGEVTYHFLYLVKNK